MDHAMNRESEIAVVETEMFVDDLKFAINAKIKIKPIEFDRICICGMGASSIGGDILINMTKQTSSVPVTVIRDMTLPKWVNKDTLIIACSYSGNTAETLSMYEQANGIGCTIVGMASGGELMRKCEEDGHVCIKMRGGVQPRNATGLTIGYMANIVESAGGAKCRREIIRAIPKLQRLKNSIGLKNPDSYAKAIADKIKGTVPVIYSTPGISGAALRWKTQLNETSKMLAFDGTLPEFNHNEIIGWSQSDMKFNCLPVFLYEEEAPEMMKAMADASIRTLKDHDINPVVVTIRGRSVIERCLRAVMFGDYVSLYSAFMKGVNPIEVRSITKLKMLVAKHFKR